MCRTEWGFSIALIAPMIFLSGPAAADQCDDLRDPEPRIVACTQSINSGKWKGHNQSINYSNRGNAYDARATTIAPSPTTTRRYASIPRMTLPITVWAAHTTTRATTTVPSPTTIRRYASIPKIARTYNNRGVTYRHKGDYDRAIADYDQALSLDPKHVTAYENRGNAYDDKGDYDRAIANYNQVISLVPKYAKAYNNRGQAYRAKGDYDRAIADYDQAISLDPK